MISAYFQLPLSIEDLNQVFSWLVATYGMSNWSWIFSVDEQYQRQEVSGLQLPERADFTVFALRFNHPFVFLNHESDF